ncbi:MAG: radical SAM protein [Parcubacteria group bacterium Athens0714_24]|nr:MAG: radical SAM protein [Parcubacteria group bacterium Athens0714_24]
MLFKYLKKDLFQLIFHVTFSCNSKCRFCFNWKELNQNKERELSLEEINKISRSLPNFDWFLLSGGEPSLRNDLAEIVGIFYKNNKIKHLTWPTNGLLPQKTFEIAQKLLADYKNLTVTVSFSLDSLAEAHDELRGIPGCYEKLLESYKLLQPLRKNKNLNLKFNTVVSNLSYGNLKNLIEKVRELKPDMHTIDFIRGDSSLTLDNLRDKELGLPPQERMEEIIELIKNNYDYYNGYSNIKKHSRIMQKVSRIIQKEYLSLFKEIIRKKEQVIPCLAYKTSLTLYPYGDISFCESLKPFANFRDFNYDYKKIIKSEPAQRQIDIIKNKKCVCYHPCYQYLNILFSPKTLIKGFLKDVF